MRSAENHRHCFNAAAPASGACAADDKEPSRNQLLEHTREQHFFFSHYSRAACAACVDGLLWQRCPLRCPGWHSANAWPSKPIKIIVNFPPGGAADQIARSLTQPLQEALGQPVVVENKSGAGSNIGGEAVAKAPPDGYTLLMSSGGMVSVNPHIYPKMPFDPTKDLVPVATAARVLVFLVTLTSFPAKDATGFLAHIRAKPGKLSFGSPGNGSSPHLAAEMMKSQAKVFAIHVPYRGAAPALNDLLAGQLEFLFDPGVAIPHIKAGQRCSPVD